jgi:hypothetical protein
VDGNMPTENFFIWLSGSINHVTGYSSYTIKFKLQEDQRTSMKLVMHEVYYITTKQKVLFVLALTSTRKKTISIGLLLQNHTMCIPFYFLLDCLRSTFYNFDCQN